MHLLTRVLSIVFLSNAAFAAIYNGDPSNYKTLLPALHPGDTLNLSAGTYPRLYISDLRGTPTAWITISGPSSGSPARIVGNACCNTVEIASSSYVAIQNFTIDSLGIDGVAGVSAKDGNDTHDILIQNNTLVGQNANQQTDGISTKIATWNWIIRGNTIIGAGTGMYLGDSSGAYPIVAGIIENNLIRDTIGYNLQVKWQLPRPSLPGMPTGQNFTIIRNNVFIKNDQPSPDGDRPNVLVGGFPSSGAGSTDMYQIYGNFFYHNPREALLQASGRVSVHDNVFVDGSKAAAVFQNHDLPLNLAYVYNNTIYSSNRGIYFGSQAVADDAVIANLVFAGTPISGSLRNSSANLTDTFANAGLYVKAPSLVLGSMDFYPLTGKAQGTAFDLSRFILDPGYAYDFNHTVKNAARQAFVFRGAYAGEGLNPGWKLQAAIKGAGAAPPATSLAGLVCSPATLSSGQSTSCTASLTAAASSATAIQIVSNNSLLAAPASITVAAGASAANFTASAGAIAVNQPAVLTASIAGGNSIQSTIILTAPPIPTGSLTGSRATPPATVSLTSEGTADWVHWGAFSASSFNRKAGVTPRISNFTVVGSGPFNRYTNNATGFSWLDGTPATTVTNTTTGVYLSTPHSGFRFTVPADTSLRTVRVYLGAYRTVGRLVAHLSDASSPDYVDSSVVNTTGATTVGVYTLTYHAGSAGQNLSITYTQDTVTGNLALQAATLAGSTTPNFSLSASPASQSVATGGSVTYNVTVTPSGGFSGTVTLGVTGAPTGTVVSSTSSSAIKLTVPSSAKAATYPLQITGASVGLTRSTPVTLIVTSASSGPQIAGSLAAPPAAVNLSSEGKADWAHWDLNSDTDFDHRAGITPLIGNYTVIGTVAAHRYTNNTTAFSWTGGTPNASASSTTTGAYTSLQNNGFRITAPADIGFRTLRVYVGVWQAQGKLVAHLSDGSAADFVDTSLTNASGPATPGVYTLLYRAATNGQKLIVTFTNNSSNGNVELQAATLY